MPSIKGTPKITTTLLTEVATAPLVGSPPKTPKAPSTLGLGSGQARNEQRNEDEEKEDEEEEDEEEEAKREQSRR